MMAWTRRKRASRGGPGRRGSHPGQVNPGAGRHRCAPPCWPVVVQRTGCDAMGKRYGSCLYEELEKRSRRRAVAHLCVCGHTRPRRRTRFEERMSHRSLVLCRGPLFFRWGLVSAIGQAKAAFGWGLGERLMRLLAMTGGPWIRHWGLAPNVPSCTVFATRSGRKGIPSYPQYPPQSSRVLRPSSRWLGFLSRSWAVRRP